MKSIPVPVRPRPRSLAVSERVYRRLLAAYPLEFRLRYGREMAQVFRTTCRQAYRASGAAGVARLWPAALWDWVWSAGRERLAALFRRSSMNATLSFDRQMGDLVWSLATGLFAGYSLQEVIGVLAITAPEPTASAIRRMNADLQAGLSLDEGLTNLLEAVPSRYLKQIIAVIQEQRRSGGNLGHMLAPLVDDFLAQVGSDGAFYPAMRQEAKDLGAQVPERAAEKRAAEKPAAG